MHISSCLYHENTVESKFLNVWVAEQKADKQVKLD